MQYQAEASVFHMRSGQAVYMRVDGRDYSRKAVTSTFYRMARSYMTMRKTLIHLEYGAHSCCFQGVTITCAIVSDWITLSRENMIRRKARKIRIPERGETCVT